MLERDQGVVDLLEIFHGRQVRDQIIAQLRRLASAEARGEAVDDATTRQAARYYEAMLITVAELLDALGDRWPLD